MNNIFSKEQQELIVEAIKNAEQQTSGEIRVHVEEKCKGDLIARASKVFVELGIHNTKQQNGVLIYISIKDRQLAILGDEGINKVVPEGFWDSTKNVMIGLFKAASYTEGLISGIEQAGEQLKKYFPFESNDTNELNNDISFGK